MQELRPGLRRWTAYHEEWRDEVASLALDTADGSILIDPLDPPRDARGPDHVIVTVFWHGRSTAELRPRRVWAPSRSAQPLRNRGVDVTDPFRAGDDLPARIEAFETPRVNEVVLWVPEHGALVVGDVLLGAGAKPRPTSDPLRLCPERWLGKGTHEELRAALRPLLDLPVELVLPAHGAPVLEHARAALERVVA